MCEQGVLKYWISLFKHLHHIKITCLGFLLYIFKWDFFYSHVLNETSPDCPAIIILDEVWSLIAVPCSKCDSLSFVCLSFGATPINGTGLQTITLEWCFVPNFCHVRQHLKLTHSMKDAWNAVIQQHELFWALGSFFNNLFW